MIKNIIIEIIITIIVLGVFAGRNYMYKRTVPTMQGDYIKWVDFNPELFMIIHFPTVNAV